MTCQTERRNLRKHIVMTQLVEAANEGRPCPSSADLCALVGYRHASSASELLKDMQADGWIAINTRGARRIVTIMATGASTGVNKRKLVKPTPAMPIAEIVREAASLFGVRPADIYGPSQFWRHVRPRSAVCRVAWLHGWSSPAIGAELARDHSTILNARDRALAYAAQCSLTAARLRRLEAIAESYNQGTGDELNKRPALAA